MFTSFLGSAGVLVSSLLIFRVNFFLVTRYFWFIGYLYLVGEFYVSGVEVALLSG